MSAPTVFDPTDSQSTVSADLLEISTPYTVKQKSGQSQYCNVRVIADGIGQPVFVETQRIRVPNGPFRKNADSNATFVFNKEDNPKLLEFVQKIEDSIEEKVFSSFH